jgi:hypothetical protein
MKKSIAFIGAMFMSVFAFAQVRKNENTNRTLSRKVMDANTAGFIFISNRSILKGNLLYSFEALL